MDFLDEIQLTGVRAFGRHGVYPDERRDGQEFVVDVTMSLPLRRAAETDDVSETVHYGVLAQRIVDIVAGEPVDLIETLASRIADAVLENQSVQTVFVTVHKPQAPIDVPFGDVSVTIRRGRIGSPA